MDVNKFLEYNYLLTLQPQGDDLEHLGNIYGNWQSKYRLNNSFPCFMNFKARGATESVKVHKTQKTSV